MFVCNMFVYLCMCVYVCVCVCVCLICMCTYAWVCVLNMFFSIWNVLCRKKYSFYTDFTLDE